MQQDKRIQSKGLNSKPKLEDIWNSASKEEHLQDPQRET